MAAPSLISSGTLDASATNVANPTNLAPGLPGTRVNGDVLLLLTSCRSATPTVATPAGWTPLANIAGTNGRIALFARAVDGTEAVPTVAWSGMTTGNSGTPALAQISCFRGLSPTLASLADVVGAASNQAAATSPGAAGAGITTLLNNDLVLVLSTRQDDAGTWATLGASDSVTWAKVVATGVTTSGSDMAQEWQYGVKTTAGAIAAKSITITGGASAASSGVIVALKAGPTNVAVGQASETDTATAITRSKTKAIGQASDTETAGAIRPQRARAIGQPSDASTANPITAAKVVHVGQASDTETADTVRPQRVVPVGQALEADAATAVAIARGVTLGQATETDASQAVTAAKVVHVGQAAESDGATSVSSAKRRAIGQAVETDTAAAVTRAKRVAVGQAVESDSAEAVTPVLVAAGTITVLIGQAVESDSAGAVTKLELEVTPGTPSNLIAGELFTLPYTSNAPLTSAVLTLADSRQLAMTIGPTALQVLLPPDTPTGPADLLVQAAIGSATFTAIAQLSGASAGVEAGGMRAGGSVTPTGDPGGPTVERRTVRTATVVAMFSTAVGFTGPPAAETTTEFASAWSDNTRPPGTATEVAMAGEGLVRATSSSSGGLPEKVYARNRKREEALLMALLDH